MFDEAPMRSASLSSIAAMCSILNIQSEFPAGLFDNEVYERFIHRRETTLPSSREPLATIAKMESLADFRKKLQDATLDARSKDQSLSTSIALLTSTHERLLASHSSLLKERDVLVSKVSDCALLIVTVSILTTRKMQVADGERHLLSITRECKSKPCSNSHSELYLSINSTVLCR